MSASSDRTGARWASYVDILNREVVPALGCTDPVAIALASALARGALGAEPERIEVMLSRNIMKNAMAAGIPGTGASGVDLAAALGAFGGDSEAGLRVLCGIGPNDVENAKRFVEAGRVAVSLKDTPEVLYIEVVHSAGTDRSRAVIRGDYTRTTLIEFNGSTVFSLGDGAPEAAGDTGAPAPDMSVEALCDFVVKAPFGQLMFILDAARMNTALAAEGMAGEYGLGLGAALKASVAAGFSGADMASLAVMETAAAVDARMAGCFLPAMTNSGSGNQGIIATVPVAVAAREMGLSDEALARALVLSHLVSIHIRHHFDRLSAMCGAIAAGTGAACGVAFLSGGRYGEVSSCIANMVGGLSGMVCDGAKSGCSLKAAASVQAAMQSAMLALKGTRVSGSEGVVEVDVERSIDNLGRLSSEGMRQTDAMVLQMMTSKP